MQINISEIISTDYKVQTFNPEIENGSILSGW